MAERLPYVAFITVLVPQYKVWLYKALDQLYAECFFALHGPERHGTRPKDVGKIEIKNNIILRNRYLLVKGIEFTWIPALLWVLKLRPKVIILQDGVRILSNYFIHALAKINGSKVIYYSHGFNHQSALMRNRMVSNVTEHIRRVLLRLSDAILVYSHAGSRYLTFWKVDVPKFVVNNTLDTDRIIRSYDAVTPSMVSQKRKLLGISPEQPVVAYLGRLVDEKRVDFLIEVIRYLTLEMGMICNGLIIGDGPVEKELKKQSVGLPVHFVGHQTGSDLSHYLSLASCVFIPRLAGLAVVEAFCAKKPVVTCVHTAHGPEVEYIRHDENGLLIESSDISILARRIFELLNNPVKLHRMSICARRTASTKCNQEKMIQAFSKAITYLTK
jgi:glycosyltransferase involved in cell wall biosynthesis